MAGIEYLLLFAQVHLEFRLPELHSVCELLDIQISYHENAIDLSTPFMRAVLPSAEAARRLGARCMLLRGVYEFWAQGPTYEDVFRMMREDDAKRTLWTAHVEKASFRFTVAGYNNAISLARQREIIETFRWMAFKGTVVMKDPDVEVCVIEDWPEPQVMKGVSKDEKRRGIWVGKKICDGPRGLIDLFHLRKRIYIGNTSMEAELSLIMASQAKAGPGKLIYDPFVGTGSMLYTSAWFGATVMGSDIDGRHIRGKDGKSVFDSAAQYGVRQRILDCLVFDLTQNPLRFGELFDAIVTDPPYGVRAGAKRLGRKDKSKLKQAPYVLPDGTLSHERPDYVPPSEPWEMSEVLDELLRQALHLLKPGGRLVYWLPTVTGDYQESDVPQLQGLKLIANSEQNFGKWARRLITMEKLAGADGPVTPLVARDAGQQPAHYDFRGSFFARFEKPTNGSDISSVQSS